MKKDHSAPPQALRLLCQEAGKQAASWAPDAARGGAVASAASPTPWRLKAGLAGGFGLLALVVGAAPFLGEPSVLMPAPAAVQPQGAALPFVAFAGASPAEPARWQGNELTIDFDEEPLTQAIMLLADATNTTVTGSHLLKAPVSVTLHLRTGDVTAAWRHLLQSHAAYSMSCSGSNCQVWISSEIAARTATAAPGAEHSQPGTEREPPAGITREEREEMESQPDGSC